MVLGCGDGAVCLEKSRECKETDCKNKLDDDWDKNFDCQDSDCDGETCGKNKICMSKKCVKIPDAKKAAAKQVVPKIQIFSYVDILKLLNKCKVKTGTGTCNKICSAQETGFPTQWKGKTITRCTCC